MSFTLTHLHEAPIPARLRERIDAMNLCLLTFDAHGQVTICSHASPLEELVVRSRLFSTCVANQNGLNPAPGIAVEFWPGVHVVSLPPERRRRGQTVGFPGPIAAVLLMTPEILRSEQLHRICDANGLDWQAVVQSIDPRSMISQSQIARMAQMIGWIQQDSVEISRRNDELHTMSSQLGDSYEELSLLYKLSANMSVNHSPAQFLSDSCEELKAVLRLKWMALQLIEDDPRLGALAGDNFLAGVPPAYESIIKPVALKLMQLEGVRLAPMIIEEPANTGIEGLADLAGNLLVVALTRESRLVGVIFGGDKIDGSRITSVDSKLCNSLASSLAIFLENTMLYEDMHAMFLGTLHALTSAIDAKDSYTHGHSERVAMLSKQLAQAAGIDPAMCERVYVAGLVHDVGKIGVPEAVLCKPGRLTAAEFELVRMHPEIGARILQDIRQMQDLIPGVLYHHERWDGKGYPRGLAGENIPIMGRLIALADSFDAMSSNRTYRQSLDPERVLGEVEHYAGTQFDPTLAKLFIKLDFTAFQQAIARHQASNHVQQTRKRA